jgi:diaminopimelate epimerase
MTYNNRAFVKAEALGNDFIIIRDNGGPEVTATEAITLCDRRKGIGADGVLLVGDSSQADLSMKVINADGSVAEMCGNGIRCVAKYAYDLGLVTKDIMSVATGAGIREVVVTKGPDGKASVIRVALGQPVFGIIEQPVAGSSDVAITTVSIGNPHAVIFVDDADKVPVASLGPAIEMLPAFPDRTNVEFTQVLDDRSLRMRVWERGAGETTACGTGAAAALAAAVKTGRTGRKATVKLDGGDLTVTWPEDGQISIEGGANIVFSGELGGI